MTYQVKCDDFLLYDPRLDRFKLPTLKLSQELNKADTLTFSIYPQHPNFDAISRLRSTISVERDGEKLCATRPLDDEVGWENGKKIVCEGPLAWLNDTVQRPFEFPLESNPTASAPSDYFAFLINRHNEQAPTDRQFVVGTVTVTDPNGYIRRSDTQYSTTWTLLKEGLLDTLGGYIVPRYVGDAIYLDYLSDFDILANQPVKFGLNMISLATKRKGADIATAILPLGARDKETDERLTIESLADSTTSDICKEGDIVYSKAAEELYGARIVAVVTWDDVTVASNLLTKATAELGVRRQLPSTVTLTAADLSAAGYDFKTFSLGTYVNIEDKWHTDAHGLLAQYLVKKLTIDILNPANNKLQLGSTTFGMSENNHKSLENAMKVVEANVSKERAQTVRQLMVYYSSAISQSEDTIRAEVSENYYTRGEAAELASSLSTAITQTASEIRFDFSSLQQDLDDVAAGANAQFSTLSRYIQFADGAITLGEVGNQITLKIENDRIGIYVNGVAVTYWTSEDFVSPQTLTIPVGGRLTLGDFAFIPRDNRSLDFTWVGA